MGSRDFSGRRYNLGQHGRRHPQQLAHGGIPSAPGEVHEQGTRGVGHLGHVGRGGRTATREPVYQERVDGPEGELALVRSSTRAIHVIEQPLELGPGEVRVEDQPGRLAHARLVASAFEFRAAIGGAPVLPHDGPVDGAAGRTLPHHGGLALVGDSDRADLVAPDGCARDGLTNGIDHALPDLVGLVLDPARFRENVERTRGWPDRASDRGYPSRARSSPWSLDRWRGCARSLPRRLSGPSPRAQTGPSARATAGNSRETPGALVPAERGR